ncbi:hypothetical protein SAMN05192553_104260 [Cyclobacterium xiamenense]|uniref:Uncharacterized protein n=1 Tax=Cyclobacterium xiamenense TaxID=1297121 RepID=A0A1H6ZCC4_9BACT|nr:hypothetical protein SAMN05192553_104260 [Cyclobacterium xiamenense]
MLLTDKKATPLDRVNNRRCIPAASRNRRRHTLLHRLRRMLEVRVFIQCLSHQHG